MYLNRIKPVDIKSTGFLNNGNKEKQMKANEYKIKYESIEEFHRMASGNIAR
mgnify:CR=1 FL=1